MFTLSKENRINSIIPDQSSLSDTIYIHRGGTIQQLKVSVGINHSFIGDISIKLLSPSGTEVILRNREGGSTNNLDVVFEDGPLAALKGESTQGPWILTVQDHAAQDDGTLDFWGIDLNCKENQTYNTEIFIPGADSLRSLTSTQECRFNGRVTKAAAEVELNHPRIDDLVISIIAPSGKEVIIHNRDGGDQQQLHKRWSNYSLKDFEGETTLGSWILKIQNFHDSNAGTLKHWKIKFHYDREDSLSILAGISPKFDTLLKEARIYSFIDLAIVTSTTLKDILVAENKEYETIDTSSWPAQASLAAQGRWAELEALKQTL